jgi:hypothetical protein
MPGTWLSIKPYSKRPFATRLWVWAEEFLTKFANPYCPMSGERFWPPGVARIGKFKNARARRAGAEQTNNKQTRDAQRDLIIGDDGVVILIVA